MRKLILVLCVLFLSEAALAAAPLRSGVYVGSKTGAMRTEMKKDGKRSEDFVFPFAVALGLRLRHIRVEAEYTFATTAKKGDYEQKTETMFAQIYYDLPFKSPIRPYFNAGGGRHTTKIEEKNVFKERRKGWAYNVGAGVTWNVSNAVNIDIGYRYLDIGDLKTRTGTIKTKHHVAYIGWRYVF